MNDLNFLNEKQITHTIKQAKTCVVCGTISKNKFETLETICNKIQSIQKDIAYQKKQNIDEVLVSKLTKLQEELNDICELMNDE